MSTNNLANYLQWISPKPLDPTYSVLKAHLLFEELIRAYLARTLPHAQSLRGARLTFAQLLAVARACCATVSPDHWMWKAIGDLNKLRNMLAHEVAAKDLANEIQDYANFVALQSKVPFPRAESAAAIDAATDTRQPIFGVVDIATLGVYIEAAANFGFDLRAFLGKESDAEAELASKLGDS